MSLSLSSASTRLASFVRNPLLSMQSFLSVLGQWTCQVGISCPVSERVTEYVAGGMYPVAFRENISIEPYNITVYKPLYQEYNTTLRFDITNTGETGLDLSLRADKTEYVRMPERLRLRVNETRTVLVNMSLPAELPKKDFAISITVDRLGWKMGEAFVNVRVVEVPSWLVDVYNSIAQNDLIRDISGEIATSRLNMLTASYVMAIFMPVFGVPKILIVLVPTAVLLYYLHKKQMRLRDKYRLYGTKFYVATILLVFLVTPVIPI